MSSVGNNHISENVFNMEVSDCIRVCMNDMLIKWLMKYLMTRLITHGARRGGGNGDLWLNITLPTSVCHFVVTYVSLPPNSSVTPQISTFIREKIS